MNPLPPPPQPFDPEEIDITWTDEQIIMLLHEYALEQRLPRNVLTDFDPFQHSPDNLPVGTWYLVDTDIGKESAFGVWVMNTEPRRIDLNPITSGWMTSWYYLNYMDGLERTNWLLQEYAMMGENYGGQEPRVKKMLCRIFQDMGNMNQEPETEPVVLVAQNEPEPAAPVIPVAGGDPYNPIFWDGEDFLELNDLEIPLPVAENEPEPAPPVIPVAEDDLNNPIFWDGEDFLELNDLEIPLSPTSSCISSLTEEDLDPQDGIEWESEELREDEEGR